MSDTLTPILIDRPSLRVGFPGLTLFENIHLTLKAGELVCFMGPNGIGKSTLIKTLAGLHAPLHSPPDFRTELFEKQIAVVLTDKIQVADMSVRELVSFGRYPYLGWNIRLSKQDHEFIDHAIELVHIQHLADKKLYQLSDGQLQLAMIARAIAQQTPVILLDEPTAHLDLNNRVEVMNLLKLLCRKENKAILVSTHELDLALQTADVLWLAMNKKIIQGIPEDLVLGGQLDELFQFKGFDLKTGKVHHEVYRQLKINLLGEGHDWLWTKNALERNGYEVSQQGAITVSIQTHQNKTSWSIDGQLENIGSIQNLLSRLTEY